MSSEAFVTLVTNDDYALGALVLAQSIHLVGTKRNLVVLVSNNLSDLLKRTLETSFDEVILVDEFDSNDNEHLRLLSRPELGITFTKINCWLLEKYSKCVEEFSAAHDAGWPDCFNSGVFVYRPSKQRFRKLMQLASQQHVSFDGGDQGLLNEFFSNWRSADISRHLPFIYNVTSNAFYSYLPAVTKFRNEIRVIHFAGSLKPWNLTYNPLNEELSGNLDGQSDIQRDFLLSWWRIMYQRVWPQLSLFNQDQSIGSLSSNILLNNETVDIGSTKHRRAWETGHIDYIGRDSYSHIQEQIEHNIAHLPSQYHPSQQRQKTPERQPTSILKKPTKEVKTSLPENIPSEISSNISTHEQQSNWTVKSTIVTTYTQGIGEFAGPTVVSKVVSESSSSSSDYPSNITSNQQNTGVGSSVQGAKSSPPSTTTKDDKHVNK
ncbi:unnamed protein product [Rotaria sp. Silwood1]|nr:unnamed protein product [Rotaria sp. Silwood1]